MLLKVALIGFLQVFKFSLKSAVIAKNGHAVLGINFIGNPLPGPVSYP